MLHFIHMHMFRRAGASLTIVILLFASLSLALLAPSSAFAATSASNSDILTILSDILKTFSKMLTSYPSQAPASTASTNYISIPAFAQSQRIDQLANIVINTPTITGGSISGASISGTLSGSLSGTGSFTSATTNTLTITTIPWVCFRQTPLEIL